MKEREILLRKLSSAQFAAWEIGMYLDTHPEDISALESLKKYETKSNLLRKEYESKFGPLKSSNASDGPGWSWINDPWPWEYDGAEQRL